MSTNDTRTDLKDERRLIEKVMGFLPACSPATTGQLANALLRRNAQLDAVLAKCDELEKWAGSIARGRPTRASAARSDAKAIRRAIEEAAG